MNPLHKQRLTSYIQHKIEVVFKSHPVNVVVTIDPDKEKISIDIQSSRLALYSIGSDRDLQKTVMRICEVSANYFNMTVTMVRLKNSLLTKQPIQYSHINREFTSWYVISFR